MGWAVHAVIVAVPYPSPEAKGSGPYFGGQLSRKDRLASQNWNETPGEGDMCNKNAARELSACRDCCSRKLSRRSALCASPTQHAEDRQSTEAQDTQVNQLGDIDELDAAKRHVVPAVTSTVRAAKPAPDRPL